MANGLAFAIVMLVVIGIFVSGVTLDHRAERRRQLADALEWDE